MPGDQLYREIRKIDDKPKVKNEISQEIVESLNYIV
jgi:hypothetical protein